MVLTRKQKKFVEAVRSGLGLEDAAAQAGFGLDYAAKLLEEPAIKAAINAPDLPDPDEIAAEPADVLRSMVYDTSLDERVRITAARALTMLERSKKLEPPAAPVIIDDIPRKENCGDCVYLRENEQKGNFFSGRR